ncbi:MAG TPA: TIM barrel protein [Opitutaceae bacterium]|jgi:sugar phosphate isomerase/epimerase
MRTPLRRALSTLGCPQLSLDGVLALAGAHGVGAVELRTLEGTTDLPALFARHGAEAVLRAQRAHPGVRVLVLSTSSKLARPGPDDRAALMAFAPWAEAMGVPWLRVFDGIGAADAGGVSGAAETVRWWQGLRREHGWKVDLLVETHDGLVTDEAINRFCSEAPGVRMLWDAHRTWRATGAEPQDLWPAIAGHVEHIHVKDSVARPSGAFPYTYVLPGDGEFPMARLRDRLGRDGYAHAVSLEWERQWHPELPPLEEALRAAGDRAWW